MLGISSGAGSLTASPEYRLGSQNTYIWLLITNIFGHRDNLVSFNDLRKSVNTNISLCKWKCAHLLYVTAIIHELYDCECGEINIWDGSTVKITRRLYFPGLAGLRVSIAHEAHR
jgi:hypothetical protein